ncbi:hypothetical protein Cri9333_0292 [Crinalium epipsammum PCC 9333]|uniref:Uncharacterized protein n=1 Tax=Crinalium epipsammum PCC 9333 TaxID=1173022 RepID=K9VT79_9CYAN|nr:hypothetical protein [Crinalium epipsammum]AFZ11278.1 hypothetical protein Cri9333_0292 [Crinalium epipsammum PCC 9333]
MKLTCSTQNSLSSIVNSVNFITTKLPLKVVVASALLIGVTGSMVMDSFVLTAPSYAQTVSKTKVSKAKKRIIAKKPVTTRKPVTTKKPVTTQRTSFRAYPKNNFSAIVQPHS